MLSRARSFILEGLDARPVRVEVDVHRGLPSFTIVGLPGAAVRESRERVRTALINSDFEFPPQRIVVNLAPASVRDSGPGLDLAIAAALLGATGQLPSDRFEQPVLVGELALDGTTRSVNGALAFAEAAQEKGAAIIVPAENAAEAALARGAEVLPVAALSELPALVSGEAPPEPPASIRLDGGAGAEVPDLADLRGQWHLRRALEVAAAGAHSLLIVGPGGAGASLAASRLPSILPPLSTEEALEVARIASACGRFRSWAGRRPFRAPHHTIGTAGLLGGGMPTRPGEVTLAHRGVLLLDELTEFSPATLEALFSVLRSGETMIARGGSVHAFPARFLLLAQAKPCPCGRGQADPACQCSPVAVNDYRERLMRLAEEIDLRVTISPPSAEEFGGPSGESSAVVCERVIAARERRARRLGSDPAAAEGKAATLRVARTIADLDGATAVRSRYIEEALALRRSED